MPKCVHCNQAKGKRACPALHGEICSLCCGRHRLVDIACPPDCPYLEGGSSRGPAMNPFNRLHERMMDWASGIAAEYTAVAFDFIGHALDNGAEFQDGFPHFLQHLALGHGAVEGDRLLSVFRRTRGAVLPVGEREALDAFEAGWFSLFEIQDVRFHEGLDVHDLVLGEHLFLTERLVTEQLQRWDIVAAWAAEHRGRQVLFGAPVFVPRQRKDVVLDAVLRQHRTLKRRHPGLPEKTLLCEAPRIVHRTLNEVQRTALPPKVVNMDGEEFLPSRAHFDVLDARRARQLLDDHPDIDPEQDENDPAAPAFWVWVDRNGREKLGEGPLILGHLRLKGGKLVLEVNSKERLARGKAFLSGLLGDAVAHRLDSLTDIDATTRKATTRPMGLLASGQSAPPEIEEHVARVLQKHLDSWIDSELPALAGKTPRQAVRTKAGRARVISMLRDQENSMLRQPGGDLVDFERVYQELGVGREGSSTAATRRS